MEVLSRCPENRTITPTAEHAVAIHWARSDPQPAGQESGEENGGAPAARADGSRNTVSESGAISLIPRAIAGTRGPWSA